MLTWQFPLPIFNSASMSEQEADALEPTQAFGLATTQLDVESDAPQEDATQRVPLAGVEHSEDDEPTSQQPETQPAEAASAETQQAPEPVDAIHELDAVDKDDATASEQPTASEIDAEFVPFTAGEGDDIDIVPEIPIAAQEHIEAAPLPSSLLVVYE